MTLASKPEAPIGYLSPIERKQLDIKEYNRQESFGRFNQNEDFYTICLKAKKHVLDFYDRKIDEKNVGNTKEDYVNIFHEAMQGIPSSVNLIHRIIEEYIVENGLRTTVYPSYYRSLVEGIFEEEFGLGALSAFRMEKECEGAQVIGTDITFKRAWGWELQPFKFRSIEKVMELTQRFANMHSKTTINEHTSPELETRTHDNIRVSIMIPDRTHLEPIITLRKKLVRELSLESMVNFGTIPKESIPIFQILSRFKLNSVVAGPPGCGKSTFLQVLLSNILYEDYKGTRIPERLKTVYAETFPEWDIRALNPFSNVLHVLGSGTEFESQITKTLLRHDISRIVLGEIREHEVGLYKRASVQGIKQIMGTLHDLDPENIPEILCNLYMQYYPNNMNHEAVQHTFNRNIHFAISMDEFPNGEDDKLLKKVTGIHIYSVNDTTKQLEIYTIMEYDFDTDSWNYTNTIPASFKKLVEKYNRQSYKQFVDTLEQLSTKSKSVTV